MRTTLMIQDELYSQVKRLATGRRSSISQVVNDALRRELSSAGNGALAIRFSMPVYGGVGTSDVTDTSPAELDALLQQEGNMP